ncbi:hypothetical protein CHM34_07000 [Paludifilum halophilum]|uniref:Uncharacterized protein n=1 Tax=Paludifilum halophilum TaxID=1642702 RepID=A0A235B9J8_9BACL|nr:hypothetical protein CHM34_07000 [Paludifilum halophilum]
MWDWLIERHNRKLEREKREAQEGKRNRFFPWTCYKCGRMFPPQEPYHEEIFVAEGDMWKEKYCFRKDCK